MLQTEDGRAKYARTLTKNEKQITKRKGAFNKSCKKLLFF